MKETNPTDLSKNGHGGKREGAGRKVAYNARTIANFSIEQRTKDALIKKFGKWEYVSELLRSYSKSLLTENAQDHECNTK